MSPISNQDRTCLTPRLHGRRLLVDVGEQTLDVDVRVRLERRLKQLATWQSWSCCWFSPLGVAVAIENILETRIQNGTLKPKHCKSHQIMHQIMYQITSNHIMVCRCWFGKTMMSLGDLMWSKLLDRIIW